MEDPIASDIRFVTLAKIRQARAMTEEQRILSGPRLFAGVCERMKEGLRDESPAGVPETNIHRLLLDRLALLSRLERRNAS